MSNFYCNNDVSEGDELYLDMDKYRRAISHMTLCQDVGKVTQSVGLLIKGFLPGASMGSVVEIKPPLNDKGILAEVVGFSGREVLFMPLSECQGIGLGSQITLLRQTATLRISDKMLGRVVNGLGEPIDGKGPIEAIEEYPLYRESANPLQRPPISEIVDLGVRSINGFTTVGKGQRVGVMAGSGVGKSVLMGMMARETSADVNVIALIGERGREVREFIEKDLGEEGLKRSVVVVATSDQSPLVRMRGAFVAMSIAEHFCQGSADVLLMMDSVTRFAMAQREVGLASGEPPASKGYTPSVFAMLPKLLERAGTFEASGSITGIYTVLVDGDDLNDPIADSVRSIVDGHIVLSRKLAERGHFPAVDVLKSTSRVMNSIVDEGHLDLSIKLREAMANYRDSEDLINLGAYKMGANPKIDSAIGVNEVLNEFLRQKVGENGSMEDTLNWMNHLASQL